MREHEKHAEIKREGRIGKASDSASTYSRQKFTKQDWYPLELSLLLLQPSWGDFAYGGNSFSL